MTKKVLNEYYEEIKDNPDISKEYKEKLEVLKKGIRAVEEQRVIVTTHASFNQMQEDFLKDYCIIIDEDILYLDYLNRTHLISENTVKKLLEKNVFGFHDIAAEIINTPLNYYKKLPLSFDSGGLTEEQIENYGLYADSDNNINDLLSVGAFVKMKDTERQENIVLYYCPQKLPHLKYIVLSATLNVDIYRSYFGESMNCIEYEECKAAYKGKVIQYTYHSLGRGDLDKKTEVFDMARKVSGKPDIPIITFRMFESEAGKNCLGMHFGNTAGLDDFKGKDIAIIGTPFKRPEAYKLPACYLGIDVNQKRDRRPVPIRVEYKGCSFIITIYQDELLREINLYSLESELEQAVGRARALREPCTVYVFSAFPCEQAELRTGEYLNNLAEDGVPAERPAECGAARGKVKKERLSAWPVQLPCGCY
ncbi:MAG: hypothetical protein LUE14_08825 [Clostridiales bacterium]|nr:hypothetical protein [Clostridiales bacterium]